MLRPLTSDCNPRARYDVAVVGAGAAGITLALMLARNGRSVFLAEGGGPEMTERSQEIYRGRVIGDPYHDLEWIRLRQFGGTTNHWSGVCRPLDAVDLRARRAAPLARWPIAYADLAAFEPEARALLGIGPQPVDRQLERSTHLVRQGWIWSDPVRFNERYGPEIAASPAIDAYTDCNLMEISAPEGRVNWLRFRNWDGYDVHIRATFVVIACGGIETPRILMLERDRSGGRMFANLPTLGAYYMDHPRAMVGSFVALKQEPFVRGAGEKEVVWGLSQTFQAKMNALNASIFLTPPDTVVGLRWVKELVCSNKDVRAAVTAMRGYEPACTAGLAMAQWEQEPIASNRIRLDAERDGLGRPRTILEWRQSALDRRTMERVALETAAYMARENIGRMKLEPWVLDRGMPLPENSPRSSIHLLGGARMAETPLLGVVDANLKVFGAENLYLASGAVFPSGGQANPTLTIVQLAVRLARRLDARLSGAARSVSTVAP